MKVSELKRLLTNVNNNARVYDQTSEVDAIIVNDKGIILSSDKGRYEKSKVLQPSTMIFSEEFYAKRILLKVLESSELGMQKRMVKTILFGYVNSVKKSNPDLDYNKICDLCLKHLENHNYL